MSKKEAHAVLTGGGLGSYHRQAPRQRVSSAAVNADQLWERVPGARMAKSSLAQQADPTLALPQGPGPQDAVSEGVQVPSLRGPVSWCFFPSWEAQVSGVSQLSPLSPP